MRYKNENKDIKYEEEIVYRHGFKVIHKTPILTPEERDRREKEAIRNLYEIFHKDINC